MKIVLSFILLISLNAYSQESVDLSRCKMGIKQTTAQNLYLDSSQNLGRSPGGYLFEMKNGKAVGLSAAKYDYAAATRISRVGGALTVVSKYGPTVVVEDSNFGWPQKITTYDQEYQLCGNNGFCKNPSNVVEEVTYRQMNVNGKAVCVTDKTTKSIDGKKHLVYSLDMCRELSLVFSKNKLNEAAKTCTDAFAKMDTDIKSVFDKNGYTHYKQEARVDDLMYGAGGMVGAALAAWNICKAWKGADIANSRFESGKNKGSSESSKSGVN